MDETNLHIASKKGGRPPKKSKISINTGRKRANINDSCKKTKYRRAQEIVASAENNVPVLEMALKIAKSKDTSNLESLDTEEEIVQINNQLRHSNDSALAFYLENNLSKRTYSALVKDSSDRGSSIYPSYRKISEEMVECRPQDYQSSEKECFVPLQNILNKTSERLCEAVIKDSDRSLQNLELMVTVGFDSSSGHTNSQQNYQEIYSENLNSQQSLFISHMIVVHLRDLEKNTHIWINPTPQSVRFFRPLRIAAEKENEETTLNEFHRLSKEIKSLCPHRFEISNGRKIKVKFTVYQTLFDGKCLNTIVKNRASTRCPMCPKTAHEFGKNYDFTANFSSLQHGLGLLHCEIKVMEYLLHLSYRLELEVWDIRKELKGNL